MENIKKLTDEFIEKALSNEKIAEVVETPKVQAEVKVASDLRKLASSLRSQLETDITYADLNDYITRYKK